jgi:hypothetical protein
VHGISGGVTASSTGGVKNDFTDPKNVIAFLLVMVPVEALHR